jgi:transcriptional regulator with XRE-family HTH domain
MDKSAQTISMHRIAERFRHARKEAGLSLREAAKRADLAPSTVQKIENNKIVPSIAVAVRLAHALNRRASYFIEEDQEAPTDVRLIPAGSGRRLGTDDTPVVFEQLAEPLINPRMEAYLITVKPGGGSESQTFTYRGEEIFVCTKGKMAIELRDKEYILTPGDTLHLKGDIPHRWSNPGPRKAEMIMIGAFSN